MSHPDRFQVEDLPREVVIKKLESVLELTTSVKNRLKLPYRTKENTIYLSGRVCMKPRENWKNRAPQTEKMKQVIHVVEVLIKLLVDNRFMTKRGLFYTNKVLFKEQSNSDALLDDICCVIGATRRSINVVAAPCGLVSGALTIRERGVEYNLAKCGALGKFISPEMLNFDIIEHENARFILIVEKEATYTSLICSRFLLKIGCILITGQGIPDMATRYFLRRLTQKLPKLPVLALVDNDAPGLQILYTYVCGAANSAFDSENLVTPGIKWLGLRPSDVEKYELSEYTTYLTCKLDGLKELMQLFADKPSWVREIQKMVDSKKQCDLGALDTTLVLQKIAKKDWLPEWPQ